MQKKGQFAIGGLPQPLRRKAIRSSMHGSLKRIFTPYLNPPSLRYYPIFEQIVHEDLRLDAEIVLFDQIPQAPVSISEALEGLATLRLYEEQQENGSRDLVRTLNRLEQELRGKRANQGTQRQIDSYFQP